MTYCTHKYVHIHTWKVCLEYYTYCFAACKYNQNILQYTYAWKSHLLKNTMRQVHGEEYTLCLNPQMLVLKTS